MQYTYTIKNVKMSAPRGIWNMRDPEDKGFINIEICIHKKEGDKGCGELTISKIYTKGRLRQILFKAKVYNRMNFDELEFIINLKIISSKSVHRYAIGKFIGRLDIYIHKRNAIYIKHILREIVSYIKYHNLIPDKTNKYYLKYLK